MAHTKTESPAKSDHRVSAQPLLGQRGRIVQEYGTVVDLPLAVDASKRLESTRVLNQVLADTIMLREVYKKAHWQVSGHTFYQLHLLLDKHYEEQDELVDLIAERIQALGGVAIATPHDVAEQTRIERPPIHRQEVPEQLSRILEAHELVLKEAHEFAKAAADAGDDGTNDLLVSDVIRTNERQVWFVAEHLVEMPVVHAK
ncbi:MAG: putative DNA-binding ferritin-like proteinDps family [Bryobacterales bacterium]|jgi:starvation-inducible DNA-binding protein|nr:putative DNA-binding ferritin-like proteinDps family [Bryobacterales bacterium]